LIFLLISRFVEFSCQRILGLKSGAINQVTLGDQPVDAINLLTTTGLFQCLSCISFG